MSNLVHPAATLMVAALIFSCSDDSGDGGVPAAGTGGSPVGMAGTGGSNATAGSGGSSGGPAAVTFTADIHPILVAKCGASDCHSGDRAPFQPGHGAADVQEAYEATQELGVEDERIYERILFRITTTEPGLMMPPTYAAPPCSGTVGAPGCISEAELELIQAWVDDGAPL